ncbi:MAG: acyl-CoA dehydrogenase family protein [Planctomycetes bacterium]|nr:acyl-CoA dehydrogenase family protein [Planctomycetota bacterium]
MIPTAEETQRWRAIAREIAEKHVRPNAARLDKVPHERWQDAYNWDAMRACGAAGLLGVFIDKEYGGQGASIVNLCTVVEELARADSGFGVAFAVNALGSFPLIVGGTEEQKKRYLPEIAAGKKLVAFCLSEKFAGSDAQNLRVRAFKDGKDWVIRGEKKWTTNGGAADLYSVFAVTDAESKSRRISAFIVEKGMKGFSIGKVEPKMGIRTVPVVETVFDDVRVPEENLLGGRAGMGFRHAMETLDLARPGVAAQAIGAAQGALDYALVYASRRRQFGQPIASFQMIQQMLADSAMAVEAGRALVLEAARAGDAKDFAKLNRLAAMCKCFATDTAMRVATDAVQIFGGYGFMEDYPAAKFFRDAKILQIYEGTNQVQRMVIARNLTKDLQHLQHLNAYIPTESQRWIEETPSIHEEDRKLETQKR